MAVASNIQKFNLRADLFGRLARLRFAAFGSAVRAGFPPRKHQHPDAVSFARLFNQRVRAAELDVVGMRPHREDVHGLYLRGAYHPSASLANVRTHTPVGPFAMKGLASSSHAVPAMSKCTHGVSSAHSFRNQAALMAPPHRPPILATSANALLSSSLYSSSRGMCHIFSPSSLAAAITRPSSASSLVNAPVLTLPSATTIAPVSVAASTRCVHPRRCAYAIASIKISRPSASVFSTSMVLPESDVTMSPGLCARLLTMFSTAGTSAVTGIDGFSCARARIAPSTAAPPHMSYFIFSMPSAGLIEMPPLSKVTPLPTSPK